MTSTSDGDGPYVFDITWDHVQDVIPNWVNRCIFIGRWLPGMVNVEVTDLENHRDAPTGTSGPHTSSTAWTVGDLVRTADNSSLARCTVAGNGGDATFVDLY